MTQPLPKDPQIAPVQLITQTAQPIWWATSVLGSGACYALWHVASSPDSEAIFISRIPTTGSDPTAICEGADPDCLRSDDGWYVSWIKKDNEAGFWAIYLSKLDEGDMRLSSTITAATEVRGIITRPFLARYDREPCLVYLDRGADGCPAIHTYFINSGSTLHDELPLADAEDAIVKCSSHHLVAVIETARDLHVFRFDEGAWKTVTNVPKENLPPCRFDFAIRDDTLMLVMSHLEDRLATLSVDLRSGKYSKKFSVCHHAKFPSIAVLSDEHWLISWVGAPVLPQKDQGKDDSDNSIGYAMAIAGITEEVNAPDGTARLNRDLTEMEEIWGRAFVPPWALLWLGLLNNGGECVKSYGPLEKGADEVWSTHLSIQGDRAILLWRTNGDVGRTEDCLLKALEVDFQNA